MTKEMLEKQIKDLRSRLSNFSTKREISEELLREKNKSLLSKLGDKDDQVRMLQQYIADREKKVDELMETLSFKDKEIEKLTDEIAALRDQRDKFKAMLSKDSANSSKPPSTDGFRKAKASSLRERSGKNPGGQFGHPGRTIQFFPNPTKIIEKKPEALCSCGGMVQCGEEYIPKQVADVRFVVDVTEERAYSGRCGNCGKIHYGEFSEEFINPVQYGSNLKTLIALLNGYGNVTINKAVDILNGISGGTLNLSEGTVVNFQKSLAEKIQQPLEIIKQRLTRYDKILEIGKAQYVAATKNKKKISYFNDERLLLKRLGEYKQEHLRFIVNFDVPFDNNGSLYLSINYSEHFKKAS